MIDFNINRRNIVLIGIGIIVLIVISQVIIISDAVNQLDTSQANFYRNLRSVTEKQ